MTDYTGFIPFIPSPQLAYPKPISNVQLNTPVFPTNSWVQTALIDTIPTNQPGIPQVFNNNNRVINLVPWYVTVCYEAREIGDNNNIFGLSHTNECDLTNTTTEGILLIQESPSFDIIIGENTYESMIFEKLDDFVSIFKQTPSLSVPGNHVRGIFSRGSAFITFVYSNAPVYLRFGGRLIIQEMTNPSPNVYSLTLEEFYTTGYNTSFFIGTNGEPPRVNESYFYDQYTQVLSPIPGGSNNITAVLNGNVLTVQMFGTTVTNGPNVFNVVGSIPGYTFQKLNDTTFSVNAISNDPIFTVSVIIAQAPVFLLSYRSSRNLIYNIVTNASLVRDAQTLTSPAFSGQLQIISGSLLSTSTAYLEGGSVSNYADDGSYDVNWLISGQLSGQIPIYGPNHWNSYNISNMTFTGIILNDPTYGDMNLYLLNSSSQTITSRFAPKNILSIPLGPPLLTNTDFNSTIVERINKDINQYLPIGVPGSSPYGAGTKASALGRLLMLWLRTATQMNNTTNINNLNTNMKNSMDAWLNGTNPNSGAGPADSFHLMHETTWGGLIVPADYYVNLVLDPPAPGSFDNSYYNDHHFQYGYLIYALYCIELYNPGYYRDRPQYHNQILHLMLDFVNPTISQFSWKTRHKDWYAGHSWATGLSLAVNRQQESVTEAINGYYAVYLLCNILGEEGATIPGLSTIKSCASCCIYNELLAAQKYYHFDAPNSNQGILERAAAVALLQLKGKSYQANFVPIPSNSNARTTGWYGITSLPFTEITRSILTQEWVNRVQNISYIFNGIRKFSYATTEDLVTGLVNASGNPVEIMQVFSLSNLTPNENIIPNPNNVLEWGLIGIEILMFGVINNNAFSSALASAALTFDAGLPNIVHETDTLSNIKYLAMYLTNDYPSTENQREIVNEGGIDTENEEIVTFKFRPSKFIRSKDNDEFVPTIQLTVDMDGTNSTNHNNVIQALYTIQDTKCHTKDKCCDKSCKGIYTTVIRTTRTNIAFLIDTGGIIVISKNLTYKIAAFDGDPIKVIAYAFMKYGLSRLLYGKLKYKYLLRRYNEKFFRDLANSRFFRFIEFFEGILVDQYGNPFTLQGYDKYFIY